MAPIKFEENIKEKLEKRAIPPSIDAWNQLSANLDNNDEKNKRGYLFYIGIAASIIGILLVTKVMFNASENQQAPQIIVETTTETKDENLDSKIENQTGEKEVVAHISEENSEENSEDKKEERQAKIEVKQIKSSIINDRQLATVSNQSANKKAADKLVKSIKDEQDIGKEENQALAITNPNDHIQEQSTVSVLTFEEIKANEVINQIEKLHIENGSVTDAEVEDLLKQAEREILRDRLYNENTRTVDADALLQDVEDDLEKSFRTKVFEGLKSGSKTLLSSIIGRNN